MKVWYGRNDKDGVTVLIDPFVVLAIEPRRSGIITVSLYKDLGSMDWNKTDINWSGCGPQSPADSLLMAKGLVQAVAIAEQLDKGIRPKL